ncbi:MAG: NUDIX domain-containing protein [bacterium]|nr:NUDIX domain-containing protein [bacterium]
MLTKGEEAELAKLIEKMEWPLPHDVFHALVKKIITVPVELAVFDKGMGRILLHYREDEEFKGWHMPGTVVRDNEDVKGAIQRLLTDELELEDNSSVTWPENHGWLEVKRKIGVRHLISLLFSCRMVKDYGGPGDFFEVNRLPNDTLKHHRVLVKEILARMGRGGL